MHTHQKANAVTKDFLLFSQPYIHEGALLTSTKSGRRLYVHHLSEVPLSEVFKTNEGNQLKRVDKVGPAARPLPPTQTDAFRIVFAHAQSKVTLSGIDISLVPHNERVAVPTAK